MKQNINVILYCRVNSNTQSESNENQKNLLMEYCKENGYSVCAIIEDVRSGKNPLSDETYALLHKYKNEAKIILITTWDRLSRSISNIAVDLRRLQEIGFDIVPVNRQVTMDLEYKFILNGLYEEK